MIYVFTTKDSNFGDLRQNTAGVLEPPAFPSLAPLEIVKVNTGKNNDY